MFTQAWVLHKRETITQGELSKEWKIFLRLLSDPH